MIAASGSSAPPLLLTEIAASRSRVIAASGSAPKVGLLLRIAASVPCRSSL